MAANTAPIYPSVGHIEGGSVKTGNVNLDGTGTLGTDISVIATGAANGSIFTRVRALALGTNVPTVLRVFWNNGSTNATAANNRLLYEFTIAANAISQVAASIPTDCPLGSNGIVLKSTERLLASVGTTIAAGLSCVAYGGDY